MTTITSAGGERISHVLLRRIREHQPRRGIPLPFLAIIVTIGIVPFVLMGLRVIALDGGNGAALSLAGTWLNQNFSLLAISAADRGAVLHVVQLPLAALLVALTRLSLGIRVLGFRAILIAIGINEIGILPSLVLIAIIACSVVLVRPLMRRSGMPLYARVSCILSLVAATMVTSLFLGIEFGSSTLSSFAFFPVVILAMLAESIADTVARESNVMAAWRTAATIVLAMVIALISAWPPLCRLTLACPELILTQLVLAVLVSELMDWRLLEDFPGQKAVKESNTGLYIAVVRNRWPSSVLRHQGNSAPKRYRLHSVQALVNELREAGNTVAVMEADAGLFKALRDFIPKSALGSTPRALVVNCAGGTQGTGRLCQVPGLCEMIGVPYTGPDVLAMAVITDQLLMAQALAARGIRTLTYREYDKSVNTETDLPGPWLVQHRFQSDRAALRPRSPASFTRAIERVCNGGDRALVATEPKGRHLRVIVLRTEDAGDKPQVLPPLEGKRGHQLAQLTERERHAAAAVAQQIFVALRCGNYARMELWLDTDGEVGVLAVRAIDIPSPRGEVATAARAAGIGFPQLIQRLLALGTAPRQINSARDCNQHILETASEKL